MKKGRNTMEDITPTDVTPETPESESSRRDFINKAVTTVGALALSGLILGNTAGEVNAADSKSSKEIKYLKYDSETSALKDTFEIKLGKWENGFRITLTGRNIGKSLQQAGILDATANVEHAVINIEFTA